MDHFSVFREHLSPSRIPTVSKEIPVVHPLIFLPFNDHYASPRYRCGLPKTASLCRDQSPWNVTRLRLKRPGCSLEKMTPKIDQGQWNTWTITTIIHISDIASQLESFFWAMQRIDQLLVTTAYLVVDTSTMDEPQKSEELWALQHTGQRLRDLIRTLNSIMRFPQNWWRRCHSNDTWWNMEEITWTVAIPFWRCSRRGIMSLSSFFHSRTTPTEAKRGGVNIEKIHTISDPWQPCGDPSTSMPPAWQFHLSFFHPGACFDQILLDYPFVSPHKTSKISDVKASPCNGSVLYFFCFSMHVHVHNFFFVFPGAKASWYPLSRPEKYHGPALLVLAPDSAERGDPFLNTDCKEHQRAMVGIRLLKSLE